MSHALLKQIAETIEPLDGWCTVERAQDLAMMVLTNRPGISTVVGVWGGRDTFALAMAHKHIGIGKVIAIDPWSASASADGQTGADLAWWNDQSKHDLVYARFIENMKRLGLEQVIDVRRMRSSEVAPILSGIVIVDANHGPEGVNDVRRFCEHVPIGGIAYLDDIQWTGGAIVNAVREIEIMGYEELFRRDTGAFFKRYK